MWFLIHILIWVKLNQCIDTCLYSTHTCLGLYKPFMTSPLDVSGCLYNLWTSILFKTHFLTLYISYPFKLSEISRENSINWTKTYYWNGFTLTLDMLWSLEMIILEYCAWMSVYTGSIGPWPNLYVIHEELKSKQSARHQRLVSNEHLDSPSTPADVFS